MNSNKNRFSHKSKLTRMPTFDKTLNKLKKEAILLKKKGCNKILIEVHRGAGIYEYENTLKAIRKAIEMGIERIETDVWLLRDKQICVLHGEKDGYITTIEKKHDLIENFEYSELKSKVILPNGDYIPLFSELLEVCRGKLKINIELKGTNLNLLNHIFIILEQTKMFDSISFSSFHHEFYERLLQLKESHKLKENIGFGFLLWQEDECKNFFYNLPKNIEINKSNSINLELTLLFKYKWIREKIRELKSKGFTIAIYFPFAIKETYQNTRFISELGVDKAICNDPMIIKKFNNYYE